MRQAKGAAARPFDTMRILSRAGLLAVLMCTVAVPLPGPAFAQDYSFGNVAIEGNVRIDAASILRFAGIERGQALSAGDLNAAYQRVVGSGLFDSVEFLPQGSTLLIRVTENPVVSVISIEGNRRLDDEALQALVGSQPRLVYSATQAEADAAAMIEAYRAQGRITATVDPKIILRSDNRVDLVFEVTEGDVVEIERLSFVGNRAFSDRRLRQVLETKQAGLLRTFIRRDTFVADRLELDKQLLRDFYLSRGHVDFEVLDATGQVTRERDGYFVTFSVREGQSFRVGQVDVVSEIAEIDAAAFEAQIRLRPGVTYSPAVIENNVARLESLALRQGLTFVSIVPRIERNEAGGMLDVTFAITRGEKVFVERIDIEGNTTTLDQVVRRQFRTAEGDPFNPREVRQSAERIRALGFFADAQVATEPGSGPDQVVVNVDVEEQPTGSLTFGVAYGASSGAALNVGLSESNFLGRGQFLGINLSTGTDNVDSSISFAEPAFLGRNLRFKFNAFYNTSDRLNANYNTRRIGLSPALEFPVSENGRLEVRYRIQQDRVSDVDTGVIDDPDTTDIDETSNGSSAILRAEEVQGKPIASSIGYTYTYDTRTGGLNPNGGVLLRFGQDFSGIGGDVRQVKTSALALAERRVFNEDVTIRAVFEGGAVNSLGDDVSRVTDRFFGNGQIRGFEPNGIGPRDLNADNRDALGGNLFAVARFEADFPLGLPEEYGITGGVFADVGSVWSLDNTAGTGGTVDDSFNLRSSVGLSIFWTTPIGPLRLNFARALSKEDYDEEQVFDLTVSTSF